jgi:hypothetical protein
MKSLTIIYWLRLAIGIIAAFACTGYVIVARNVETIFDLTTFMNGLSIAIIIYLVSYYLIKGKFVLKVEKPQKIFTTGIGIYFLSWIVFWILIYTIIAEQLNLLPPL